MNKIKVSSAIFILIYTSSVQAEVKQIIKHSHNGRYHVHVLPKEGINHVHGGKRAQSNNTNQKQAPNIRIHDCDKLAANPNDPQRKAKGVYMEHINTPQALDACKLAVKKSPNNGRFQYQYGRILDRLGLHQQAIQSYKKAAHNKHFIANYNLGLTYQDNLNNSQEAVKWYKNGVQQGEVNSMIALGNYYFEQKKDHLDKLAEQLYLKAAKKGDADAMWNLSIFYDKTFDFPKGNLWRRKARAAGSKEAKNYYRYHNRQEQLARDCPRSNFEMKREYLDCLYAHPLY